MSVKHGPRMLEKYGTEGLGVRPFAWKLPVEAGKLGRKAPAFFFLKALKGYLEESQYGQDKRIKRRQHLLKK